MGLKITKAKAPQVEEQRKGPTTLEERLAMNEPNAAERLAAADSALEDAADVEVEEAPPAPPPRPTPKTSPSPYLGMPVLHRTQDKARQYNGSDIHPAVITHVWPACVNVKVLPDCGPPYDATSQQRIAYADVEAQGWFTVEEARST